MTNNLQEFWDLVVTIWGSAFLGVSVGRALVALLIILVFFVLRSLLARWVIAYLKRLVKKTSTEVDDLIIEATEDPLKLVPIALGVFLASQYLGLEGAAQTFANNVDESLIVIIIFWSLYRMVDAFSGTFHALERILTRPLLNWLVNALKALFAFVGLAALLEVWGIQVGPLIAGAGLFGVAIALGAQDMFKNLISGISIIIERRFSIGDWILVQGVVEGTVENIGFRSTMVRQFDKAEVYVPNSKLSDDAVVNFSKMTYRRIKWIIGLEYRTTIPQLREIRDEIEKYVHETDDFASPSAASTFVRIDSFNDSSIDVLLYCFTKTTVWGEWLQIKEALAIKVKEIVEGAGAGFAFPSQSLYHEQLPPGEKPEVFVPPTTSALPVGSAGA